MTSPTPLSPRHEALNSILQVRQSLAKATLDADTWDKIVSIAWDHRTNSGDRRDVQRALRDVLLEASRGGGASGATP